MQALLSRYGPEKLYQVTSNVSGAGTLDLTLLRGQIVALLQNKDTKGNSSRWLVDTGGTWGFMGSSPPSGETPQQEPAEIGVWAGVWLCKSGMGTDTGENAGLGAQPA